MVHKKSTYRLTYRNYSPNIRKTVWQENNDIRLRRREEERSHHSLEETDHDCECDESEEEDQTEGLPVRVGSLSATRGRLANSQEQIQQHRTLPTQPVGPPPHVPRLRFSPDPSPRISEQPRTPDSADEGDTKEDRGTSEQHDGNEGSVADMQEMHAVDGLTVHSRNRARSSSIQLGVMRPGSQAREYDLIPAVREEMDGTAVRAASAGTKVMKSRQVPLTSQLSRTTRRNYHNRDRISYVPYGTGSNVRHIGDKTSFNVHLNKTQVRPSALQASSFRNKEIENLIKRQRNLTINDWRGERNSAQPVNHSSLWANGRQQIFSSRRKPRERMRRASSRVEVFSNYCKHCGGRK